MRKNGFTIMEVMVVTIIVGVICVFAIPGYNKMMTAERVRGLRDQVRTIHGAEQLFFAREGHYYPMYPDNEDIHVCNGSQAQWQCMDIWPSVYEKALAISLSKDTQEYIFQFQGFSSTNSTYLSACLPDPATTNCSGAAPLLLTFYPEKPLHTSSPPNNSTDNPTCSGNLCASYQQYWAFP